MVLPLWDENPFRYDAKPLICWSLIAINVAILFTQVSGGPEQAAAVAAGFGATPAAVLHLNPVAVAMQHDGAQGWLRPELTLVTSMFLHGDLGHLFGNMLFLFVFGDNVEHTIGHWRFLAFYLLSGVAATLVYVVSAPASTDPLIGASGAIAGVVAAYAMTRPCAKITVLAFGIPVRVRSIWVLGGWAAWQIVQIMSQPTDNVAYWAHVGGLLAGAAMFPLIKPAHVELFECFNPDEFRPQNAR